MIHDLDVVLTFVKSEWKEIRASGCRFFPARSTLRMFASNFASGCVANFTASRVSTRARSQLRFFQMGQYISNRLRTAGRPGVFGRRRGGERPA